MYAMWIQVLGSALIGWALSILVYRCLKSSEPRKKLLATFKDNKSALIPSETPFLLFAVGTRGDVQPMVALGLELKRRGFPVCICTLDQFQPFVEGYGLTFASCGIASLTDQEAGWLQASSEAEFLSIVAASYLPKVDHIGQALLRACRSHEAKCIITGFYGLHLALDVAEHCQTKIRAIKYMPDSITRQYPPFGTRKSGLLAKFEWYNLALHYRRLIRMVIAARKFGLTRVQNAFRKERLNLPAITAERLEAAGRYLPTMFAYSSHLGPNPDDWPPWHKVFGFFFMPSIENSRLSPEIESFLRESGSVPVVVVTFGSMNSLKAAGCDIIRNCCRASLSLGLRVILLTNWSEADASSITSSKDLLIASSAPHELLVPRCALAIHHGGAGTTARTSQAGIPSIIIPVLKWFDQTGWAMAVESAGAGIHVDNVFIGEDAIQAIIYRIACDPEQRADYRRKAQILSKQLESERAAVQDAVDWLTAPLSPIEYDSRFSLAAIERMVKRSCLFH